jgi:hypothetical protein
MEGGKKDGNSAQAQEKSIGGGGNHHHHQDGVMRVFAWSVLYIAASTQQPALLLLPLSTMTAALGHFLLLKPEQGWKEVQQSASVIFLASSFG